MPSWNTTMTCALVALATSAAADTNTTVAKKGKAGKQLVMMTADQITWNDAPPDLPKGGKMAVLFGDPSKKGMFTARVKVPDGYKVPPHWHTNDEELTIITGTMIMRMGDSMTSEPHVLTAGAYHFLPGKTHHSAEAKGETIIQIHSTGPFDIHYINAADNPNPKPHKTATR
jgi:mannose-6-phosphate isomerase-like protein (cupin superfamily)